MEVVKPSDPKLQQHAHSVPPPSAPPSPAMVYFVVLSTVLFSIIHIHNVVLAAEHSSLSLPALALLTFETLLEVGASWYAFTLLFIAAAYLLKTPPEIVRRPLDRSPPLGVVHLCCEVFDRDSFENLANLNYGGVAFEFADEWWKNYDNPKRPGDWWDRKQAPDDEKTHDQDPEEYYGIMTAERQPRPAAATVKRMFATATARQDRTVPEVVSSALVLLALGSWFWVRRRGQKNGE